MAWAYFIEAKGYRNRFAFYASQELSYLSSIRKELLHFVLNLPFSRGTNPQTIHLLYLLYQNIGF